MSTTEAIQAIARNSIRLITDADILARAQRGQNAMSSAIIAIEEADKLWHVATGKTAPPAHAKKQMLFGLLSYIALSWRRMVPWAKILRDGLEPGAILSEDQKKALVHPEFVDFVRRVQAGELADGERRWLVLFMAHMAALQRDGTVDAFTIFTAGNLNKMPKEATYVDVENGAVISDPATVDTGLLPILILFSAWFLMGMLIICVSQKALQREEAIALLKLLPDELTGVDVLRSGFEQWPFESGSEVACDSAYDMNADASQRDRHGQGCDHGALQSR